jgi:hypothetical protein
MLRSWQERAPGLTGRTSGAAVTRVCGPSAPGSGPRMAVRRSRALVLGPRMAFRRPRFPELSPRWWTCHSFLTFASRGRRALARGNHHSVISARGLGLGGVMILRSRSACLGLSLSHIGWMRGTDPVGAVVGTGNASLGSAFVSDLKLTGGRRATSSARLQSRPRIRSSGPSPWPPHRGGQGRATNRPLQRQVRPGLLGDHVRGVPGGPVVVLARAVQ